MSPREQVLREMLIEQAVSVVDEVLEWQASHPEAELWDLEQTLQRLRHKLTAVWLNTLVKVRAEDQATEQLSCPTCGGQLAPKGNKPRQITTVVGELVFERGYYYCASCRGGFFPPGCELTPAQGALE